MNLLNNKETDKSPRKAIGGLQQQNSKPPEESIHILSKYLDTLCKIKFSFIYYHFLEIKKTQLHV